MIMLMVDIIIIKISILLRIKLRLVLWALGITICIAVVNFSFLLSLFSLSIITVTIVSNHYSVDGDNNKILALLIAVLLSSFFFFFIETSYHPFYQFINLSLFYHNPYHTSPSSSLVQIRPQERTRIQHVHIPQVRPPARFPPNRSRARREQRLRLER